MIKNEFLNLMLQVDVTLLVILLSVLIAIVDIFLVVKTLTRKK